MTSGENRAISAIIVAGDRNRGDGVYSKKFNVFSKESQDEACQDRGVMHCKSWTEESLVMRGTIACRYLR